MLLQPLRSAEACSLFREVGAYASAHAVQLVASTATLSLEEMSSLGEFRHAGYIALLVASAAGGANVIRGEERVRPKCHIAMSALFIGGKALTAMADGASEF